MDFSVVINDLDGEPFTDQMALQANGYYPLLAKFQADPQNNKEPEKVLLTLGAACRHALCSNFQDEPQLSGEERFERGLLAYKIKQGNPELSSENISLIKRLLGKLYGPEVILTSWSLLDPAEASKVTGAA